MIPVPEVTQVDIAFPARGTELAPELDQIPQEFHYHPWWSQFWCPIWTQAPHRNPQDVQLSPREGVDAQAAWNVLTVVLGCYGIQQERKRAAMAFLSDQWFEDGWWPTDEVTAVHGVPVPVLGDEGEQEHG